MSRFGCSNTNGMPSTPSQKSIDVCRSAPTIVMWWTPCVCSLRTMRTISTAATECLSSMWPMPALIFDCDGVIAESERDGHWPAFNRRSRSSGVPVRWSEDEYGEKLLGQRRQGAGRDGAARRSCVRAAGLPGDPAGRREWLARFHERKTAIFREIADGRRPPAAAGRSCGSSTRRSRAGWTLAVASTASDASVRDHPRRRARRRARRGASPCSRGDVVPVKKPDPAIYRLALERLGATAAGEAVVIEDSRNRAARGDRRGAAAASSRRAASRAARTSPRPRSSSRALGDPGEPMEVLANRSTATPASHVTLQDVAGLLR